MLRRVIGRILMVGGLLGGVGCLVAGAFFSDFRLGGTPRCLGGNTTGCERVVPGEIAFTGGAGDRTAGDRHGVPIRFTADGGGESDTASLALTAEERAAVERVEVQGLYVDGELIGVLTPAGNEYYSVDVAQGGLFQFAALGFTVMLVGFIVYWIRPRRDAVA